ncbi:MAG: amidohydrolase [Alphaproteobacteria bacterium]|nr:amidohydrolase [Alphaproteobacteria bacterium]
MTILIQNVLHENKNADILIDKGRFAKIASALSLSAESAGTVIDGSDKAILPAFYNLHTHAAMSLLRGLGDDKELFHWLSEDIWPREATFDDEIIYWGTKLAMLEMIHSGTVAFSDMYFEQKAIMQAVCDMGLRAAVSFVQMDFFEQEKTAAKKADTAKFLALENPCPERISKVMAVHAVYTVSEELIRFAVQTAEENNMFLHIHACETQKEVDDCIAAHGCSPIEYMEKLGALSPRTILAHAVHLSDSDIDIILKHGVKLCTNPASNLKLCSGAFMFKKLWDSGAFITLGTDGSASNNNVSMLDEMKLAALSAKLQSGDPTAAAAEQVFQAATRNGAEALGIDAGVIAEGKLADCILVDLNNTLLVPNYNLISNMVYSADSSVIDTVLCNGRILMQNKKIDGEEEIISQARKIAAKLA